jgi:hypothetical protein
MFNTYRVWWATNSGDNMARVLDVRRYSGAYPQWFTHDLKLEAPGTHRGWLEMSVNLKDEPLCTST